MKSLNENEKAVQIPELEQKRSLKQKEIATLRKSRDESKKNKQKCMAESAQQTAIMADVANKRKKLWGKFRKYKETCREKSRAYTVEEQAAASRRKEINVDRRIFKKEQDDAKNQLRLLHWEVNQIDTEIEKLKKADTCNDDNPEQSNE